jgi:hypothetical protein
MTRLRCSGVRAWGVSCVALLVSLLVTDVSDAEGITGASAVQKASPPLDEVVVVGEKLPQVQQRIFDVEDHFNALYNQLNTRHEFDVQCVSEAPTMSNIRRRLCKATYVARAEREESIAFLEGHAAPPAELVAQLHRDEYRKNMLEVVRKSPQLQRLLLERAALAARYRQVTQDRFKGHWILFNE